MIGKAKSISHGINALRYITGESRNKKHPELIYHIKDNPTSRTTCFRADSMRRAYGT